MKVELDKQDMISLVKGTSPNYKMMDNPVIKQAGRYIGGMSDRWEWKSEIQHLEEAILWEIYQLCKNSWK